MTEEEAKERRSLETGRAGKLKPTVCPHLLPLAQVGGVVVAIAVL